jgi:hypothetical protein
MDIVEFLQLSTGKWFSQRTSHHLAFRQSESGKSNILIDLLPATDPVVADLCQRYDVAPELALCGARVTWDGGMEWDKKQRSGSTVLVPIADPDAANQGKLLHQIGHSDQAPVAGRYVIGNDEALALIVETDTLYIEERIWFASPNLRLRTSILKQVDGFSMASFCSEIRMGVTQAPPPATQAAGSSVGS